MPRWPERSTAERFMDKVGVAASGCWEWRAHRHNGYGRFTIGVGQTSQKAHRVAYELFVGPIPDGLTIDHLCRNTGCVNPEHLEPVPLVVNVLRGESAPAQNARKTHCPQGHAYEGDNLYVAPGSGYRQCRTCNAERERRRARRAA